MTEGLNLKSKKLNRLLKTLKISKIPNRKMFLFAKDQGT